MGRVLKLLNGLGVAALAAILSFHLPVSEILLTLYSAFLAEWCARFICDLPQNRTFQISRLEQSLLCWIGLSIAVGAGFYLQIMPLYHDWPFALLSVIGLALVLTLFRLTFQTPAKAASVLLFLMSTRYVWWAAASLGLTSLAALTLSATLGLSLMLGVIPAALCFNTIRLEPDGQANRIVRGSFPLISAVRDVDIVIVPWILLPDVAILYISMRLAASPIVVTQILMQRMATFQFWPQKDKVSDKHFVAQAARLNLGALLIGGGAALAVLSIGPTAIMVIDLPAETASAVLHLLVLGACAPAIFGLAPVLMRVAGEAELQRVIDLSVIAVMPAVFFLQTRQDALALAATYAGLQISYSSVSAGVLAYRVGVWPGPTAILFRQIKLS